MRILIVHNSYQQAGGEDAVVGREFDLLQASGDTVALHLVSNDIISGIGQKLKTALNVVYSAAARDDLIGAIRRFGPDIVHVHNTFPLLTPSIFDACQTTGTPVVMTLHNYRLTCASALLMRNGAVCEKCVNGSPYWGVVHRCYRNSAIGSLALANLINVHRNQGTWQTKVNGFIALTEFARRKFIEAGLPQNRIVVKPNFVPDPGKAPGAPRMGALYVGRLSEEKGVRELIRAWQDIPYPLTIAGEGPLEAELRAAASGNVQFRGWLSTQEVRAEMFRAAFLVLPSVCYETFSMSIAEAFSCGLPAIVSRLGAMAENVANGENGLHFTAGDAADLAAKVDFAISQPERLRHMGENARLEYELKYTPEENYRVMRTIYGGVIAAVKMSRNPALAETSEIWLKSFI